MKKSNETAVRSEKPKPERTVTKADIIEDVAAKLAITRKQAESVVECILEGIIGSLQGGEKIELRGFGSFRLRQRGPRIARNPKKAGVQVEVPAKSIPFFKPGKLLRELLNGGKLPAGPAKPRRKAVAPE